jgi:hypothetical protein
MVVHPLYLHEYTKRDEQQGNDHEGGKHIVVQAVGDAFGQVVLRGCCSAFLITLPAAIFIITLPAAAFDSALPAADGQGVTAFTNTTPFGVMCSMMTGLEGSREPA